MERETEKGKPQAVGRFFRPPAAFRSFFFPLQRLAADLLRLFLPQRCGLCGRRLDEGPEVVCAACYCDLPFTRFHGRPGNPVERLFWGRLPIVRANAFFRYVPGADSSRLFLGLKYYDRPQTGRYFGRLMTADLAADGFFEGISLIVPVPLAPDRQRRRGYNQSEWLARGIAEVTGLPVAAEVVRRVRSNPSQTRLSAWQRRANVEGIFALADEARLAGRHVLVVDDILTTGSTLLSCASEVARVPGVRVSILVMGIAGRHPESVVPPQQRPEQC